MRCVVHRDRHIVLQVVKNHAVLHSCGADAALLRCQAAGCTMMKGNLASGFRSMGTHVTCAIAAKHYRTNPSISSTGAVNNEWDIASEFDFRLPQLRDVLQLRCQPLLREERNTHC